MFKLKQNSVGDIFKLKEGLSCLIAAKPNSGTTSFSVDIVSRLIKENDDVFVKYITTQKDTTKINTYFEDSYDNKLENQLSMEEFFSRIDLEEITSKVQIETFLSYLEREISKNKFNVLVIDYFQSLFSSINFIDDIMLSLIIWANVNKVQLIIVYKLNSNFKGDFIDMTIQARINTIVHLEKNDYTLLTVVKGIGLYNRFKFLLKLDSSTNNYFNDYWVGEQRRKVFNEQMFLKNKTFCNEFSWNTDIDEDISILSWDLFYEKYVDCKSTKLKEELRHSIFLGENLIDLDSVSFIQMSKEIYGYIDPNFIRRFINEKKLENSITPEYLDLDSIAILKDFFIKNKITLKRFTEIMISSNFHDFVYFIQTTDTISKILEKEREYSFNFFPEKPNNVNTMRKVFTLIKEGSAKLQNYSNLIKETEFYRKQAEIKFIEKLQFGEFTLKVIDTIDDLFYYSEKLGNCLFSSRYINDVVMDDDHLVAIYKEDQLYGAIHFNKAFKLIEMRKSKNKDFTKEDIAKYSDLLSSMNNLL